MFRISFSTDGKTWHEDLSTDSESYLQISRVARARSRDLKRIERITNLELGKVLVAFKDGYADSTYYSPIMPPNSPRSL